MSNQEKYNECFVRGLEIEAEIVREDLSYNELENWDSVGHMALIAELEDTFGIMMETDDIIDFSSYAKGKEILSKYGVEI
jgi:acyl carrier protein